MKGIARLTALAIACIAALPLAAGADGGKSHANACAAKARGPYGFHCIGYSNVGAGLEPVSFGGVVAANKAGIYEGYLTFNSSLGAQTLHVAGPAVFGQNGAGETVFEGTCFGHVDYTTTEVIQDGKVVATLPPLGADFAVVEDGAEILGVPVAPPGVTGDLVPRLNCRLVRMHKGD